MAGSAWAGRKRGPPPPRQAAAAEVPTAALRCHGAGSGRDGLQASAQAATRAPREPHLQRRLLPLEVLVLRLQLLRLVLRRRDLAVQRLDLQGRRAGAAVE